MYPNRSQPTQLYDMYTKFLKCSVLNIHTHSTSYARSLLNVVFAFVGGYSSDIVSLSIIIEILDNYINLLGIDCSERNAQ